MSFQDITTHVAAILADEDTPADLYNSLSERVLEIADRHRVNLFHPAVLPVALPVALAAEAGAATQLHPAEAPSPYQRHADIIADLLESEETPEVLHTMLDHFCSELSNNLSEGNECACSPETVRKHLPALLARAEAKGLRVDTGGVMLAKGGDS